MRKQSLLWLFFVTSCSLAFNTETGRCLVDEDCDDGLICAQIDDENDLAGGVCVLNEPNPLTFAIDISPLPNQKVLRHQQIFNPTKLFASNTPQAQLGNFTLEEAIVVPGVVAAIGAGQTPQVSISATLLEDPLIKGTGRETFFTTSDANGEFSLEVRPGLYDIVATSQDGSLPPLVLKGVSLPVTGGGSLSLTLSSSNQLRGVLTSNGQPLEGFRVSASAEDDLLGLRSTVATTAADGSFSLAISPNESKLVFRYEPDAEGPNSIAPVVEQLVVLSSLATIDGFLDLGVFDTGVIDAPLELIGQVSGPGANTNDTVDASDTTVLTFTRLEDPNSNRSFSRKTNVGNNGEYSVQLLPGLYRVSVQTPAPNEFASGDLGVIDFLCAAAPCPAVDLTLQRRHKIFGEILNTRGDIIPEVFVVEARAANQPAGNPVQSTISDASLRGFELLLDPGVYDLTFLPPVSGGLAQGLLFGVDVLEEDIRVDANIPPPSLLVGEIAANANMGTISPPQATIRVFAMSNTGDFYLLSVLTTDDKGNFAAVVPNPAGSEAQFFPTP